jgi:hypothetical protein
MVERKELHIAKIQFATNEELERALDKIAKGDLTKVSNLPVEPLVDFLQKRKVVLLYALALDDGSLDSRAISCNISLPPHIIRALFASVVQDFTIHLSEIKPYEGDKK